MTKIKTGGSMLKKTKDRGSWILTYTGKKFYHLDPRASDISIYDIAHSLSLLCRFAGHTKVFYSVAQHSVEISHQVPEEYALWGLMHDATETYYVDVPRPLKHMFGMEFYREGERDLMKVIAKKFGLKPLEEPAEVKLADNVMLVTEQRDLMNYVYASPVKPLPKTIIPWTSEFAEGAFLGRFKELTGHL